MLQLTFNPGLTLTGFRTTRPSSVDVDKFLKLLSVNWLFQLNELQAYHE